MFGLSLVALLGYLAPAYSQPPHFSSEDTIPNPTDAQFDSFVTLRGYDFDTRMGIAGESVDVDLYWEVTGKPPGDYLLFVHMIDELGTMVTQRDTHPGLGSFPSSQWEIGDRFVDTVRLHIPQTTYTPSNALVSIGLYAPIEGYRLAITAPNGDGVGDVLELGEVLLSTDLGRPSMIPHPLVQNFGNEILLSGYEYDRREIRPGEVLTVDFYWQALQDNLPDYMVQIRLKDETGQIFETSEHRPLQGELPTSTWQAGDAVVDRQELQIPASLSPGVYHVQVALIDPESRQRQNIVAEDGHWIDETLKLAGLRVIP
jgi:hypothetical protein